MDQPEFKQHVEALYPELPRYARGRLNEPRASAERRAVDVVHVAVLDLLERGGYEWAKTRADPADGRKMDATGPTPHAVRPAPVAEVLAAIQ